MRFVASPIRSRSPCTPQLQKDEVCVFVEVKRGANSPASCGSENKKREARTESCRPISFQSLALSKMKLPSQRSYCYP
jgi:hypothetical protein